MQRKDGGLLTCYVCLFVDYIHLLQKCYGILPYSMLLLSLAAPLNNRQKPTQDTEFFRIMLCPKFLADYYILTPTPTLGWELMKWMDSYGSFVAAPLHDEGECVTLQLSSGYTTISCCLCTHCHATFKVFRVGDFCANSYVIGVCSMLILLPMWPQECFPLFCVFLWIAKSIFWWEEDTWTLHKSTWKLFHQGLG